MEGKRLINLEASKTALLVVHLQNDIVSPGTAFGSLFEPEATARSTVAQCNAAMASLRTSGGLVVPLRIAFNPDFSDLSPNVPLLQIVAGAGCLKEGTPGAEIVGALDVTPAELVVTHTRPGPFTGSVLQELLDQRGIVNVVVCGVATNASVEGAVRQSADLGYSTFFLTDACSAADAAAHEASLASMGLFGTPLTVEEFATDLR